MFYFDYINNFSSSCLLSRKSLCVIGLASSHIAFKDEGGVTAVDFNVGKSDRSGVKVTGKRKKVGFLTHSLLQFGGCLAFKIFLVNQSLHIT